MKTLLTKNGLLVMIIIVALGVISYFAVDYHSINSVKLSPPINPPKFSVSYLYGSSLGRATAGAEIHTDIENIRNAGFDGVKVTYSFRQDNVTANEIVRQAAKNGLYPIGQFNGHQEKSRDRAFTNEELTEWEDFVRKEVRRNRNIVYYWEVWNEPCMTALIFRYGTPSEYLELLARTQKIIKEENPNAKVIVTADFGDEEAEAFTNEFLNLGGAKYLDYLSFHPYNALDPNSRFDLPETIAQEIALSVKYNKPLWVSEIGYADSKSNEGKQSEIALTLFQSANQNNIPIVWFHWSDRLIPSVDGETGWGLVRENNSFKPAYEDIKEFILSLD